MQDNRYFLTSMQQDLRKMVRDFADKEIIPAMADDSEGKFPMDLLRKAQQMELHICTIPEEYGGMGLDTLTYAIIKEELARGDAGLTTVVSACLSSVTPVKIAGTKEQMKAYCGILKEGGIGAFALTEPNSGSDAAALTMRYARDGDCFILNGRKGFITNGEFADVATVFATHDRNLRANGISAFIVDMHAPGISIGKHEDKMGVRSSVTNDIVFEDVRIPAKNLIGLEGQGHKIAMTTLGYSRPSAGAGAIGNAQYAFEVAVEYSKVRQTFGKPICKNQGISFILADMYTKLESARQMVWYCCRCADAGIRDMRLASAAKYLAADNGMAVCTDAVQILGGYGYSREYPVEKRFRDAKVYQIFEGTNQIQRMVVAGDILNS